MFGQAIDILKKNPVIVIFYVIWFAVCELLSMTIIPREAGYNGPLQAIVLLCQVILVSLVLGILGLIFFSGYGKMLAEAATTGKTSAGSFLQGLRKYFVRLLLATLLSLAFITGFLIILGIISIPLSLIGAILSRGDMASITVLVTVIITLLANIILLFIIPLIILWYPAMIIDDVGTVEGLKRGAKAGVKSYWILVSASLVPVLPSVVYSLKSAISMVSGGITAAVLVNSPVYWVIMLIVFVISQFAMVLIFILYHNLNIKQRRDINEKV